MPSPTQKILAGIDGTTYDIGADASVAFSDAILGLPTSGGELFVYPPSTAGTKYLFQSSVLVRRSNATIRFAPGTSLDFAPGSSAASMFDVPLRNFRCHGARVQHAISAATTNRTFFLVRDRPAPQTSNNAAFYDCVFDIEQATAAPIQSFSCIRAEGYDSSGRRGLLVHRCQFLFRPGQAQGHAWTAGDEPLGACAVRTNASQGTILTGSALRGATTGAKGDCGVLVLWDCGHYSIFGDNHVSDLRLVDKSGELAPSLRSSLIRMRKPACAEGHHSLVSCSLFQNCEVDHAVSLLDAYYDHVTGNDFGGLTGHCLGVLWASGSPLVLCANGAHGLSHGTPSTAQGVFSLLNSSEVTISAGFVTEAPHGLPLLRTEGVCRGIHVSPHQVVRPGE